MAHPMQEYRQHKVERSRVAHIAGKASGGGIHSDVSEDKKMIRGMVKNAALKASGARQKPRLDRFARGGKVGKKGSTTVNVMIAQPPQQERPEPQTPPMPSPAAPPPMPPRPPMPMAGPPGMPPGAPPPGIRSTGGRAYAKGGAVKSGRAWEEGRKAGTQVTHSPGKNDSDKINRSPALLTRKRGGAVKKADGGEVRQLGTARADRLNEMARSAGAVAGSMGVGLLGRSNLAGIQRSPSASQEVDSIIQRQRASDDQSRIGRKRGGRAYPLTAGSDSGVGRLQKTRAQKKQ